VEQHFWQKDSALAYPPEKKAVAVLILTLGIGANNCYLQLVVRHVSRTAAVPGRNTLRIDRTRYAKGRR